MPPLLSLIPELEDAVQSGSADRRAEMLARVTTLFLADSHRYNEDHIRLFDDLFIHLVEEIETKARAELSRRLAPLHRAPQNTVRMLANDDDISVAGPVLSQSPRLGEDDLLAIAREKSQAHLAAISGRRRLDETLTGVLVDRGNAEVLRKVAANKSARLSPESFSKVILRAEDDGDLAETVAARDDLPDYLFRELVMRATEVVQRRLFAAAKPETQADIRHVLEKISDDVKAAAAPARDFTAALEQMRAMKGEGKLREGDVAGYAAAGNYEETAAALSVLCGVSIEIVDRLMSGPRPDPVLILCKAPGFSWGTARAVIRVRPAVEGKSGQSMEMAYANFDKLSRSTAQRVVRFWQASQARY